MSSSAATDWANKRRAQVLRAEQLRQQRKAGVADDSPQVGRQQQRNAPPQASSYQSRGGDSLDHLAGAQMSRGYDPNDPMEAPLPGARGAAASGGLQVATNLSVHNSQPQPISPSGDALGKEMKRFPTTPTRTNRSHANNDFGGASLGDVLAGGRQQQQQQAGTQPSAFRSKFMQQYEIQTGQPYQAAASLPVQQEPPQPKPQDLADEAFMQTLRSAANPSGNTPGARRGANKPSWNDDVVSSSPYANGFGEPPAIVKKQPVVTATRKDAAREDVSSRRRGSGAGLATTNNSGANTSTSNANRANEWNSDISYAPIDSSNAPRAGGRRHQQPTQESPRQQPVRDTSPRLQDRDRERGEASGQGLGQARSRLSLLKLKMRQSESGGGSRSSLASEHGRSSPSLLDYGENSSAVAQKQSQPRTAPNGRRDDGHHGAAPGGGGSYLEEHRKNTMRDRSKPPPSSSRTQHQSYLQQQEDEAERSAREYREEEAAYRQSLLRDREEPHREGAYPRADGVGGGGSRVRPKPVPHQERQQPERQSGFGRERDRDTTMNANSNASNHTKPSRVQSYQDDEDETGPYTPYAQPASSSSSSQYNANSNSDAPDPYETGPVGEQKECPDCGRRFNPIPYARHVKICAKVFVEKRKVFDSKKMRIQDNPELVKILKQTAAKGKKAGAVPARGGASKPSGFRGDSDAFGGGGGGGGGFGGYDAPMPAAVSKPAARAAPRAASPPASSDANTNSKAKWKQDSNAFREAMRAARQVTKAIATGAPLPPPTYSAPDPSMMQCPTCGRRFNQKAGERHIPQCANIMAKPKSLMAHSGKAAVSGGAPARGSKGGVRF